MQLKSYAKFRIRGAILDSLREMDWSPRHLRRQARRIEEAHRDLKLRLGRVATEPELAAEMGMPLDDFQHLLGELRGLDLGSLQAESMDPQSEDEVASYAFRRQPKKIRSSYAWTEKSDRTSPRRSKTWTKRKNKS